MENAAGLNLNAFSALMERQENCSKIECGRVLIIAGSKELSFAAYLNAMSVLRSGTGWSVLATTDSVAKMISASHLEIKVTTLPETQQGYIDRNSIDIILPILKQVNVVMIGAGLGSSKETEEFIVELFLASIQFPKLYWIVDAAALKPLFEAKSALKLSLCSLLNQVWVPNEWELKMIFGKQLPDAKEDRINMLHDLSLEFGMSWVYKGKNSEVISPYSRYMNSTGNPGMAVTGMGDILGGLIASFKAQGMEFWDAICWATYLHGHVGDILYKRLGIGLLPSDFNYIIPRTMQNIYKKIRAGSFGISE